MAYDSQKMMNDILRTMVHVKEGPLKGLEGLIKKINLHTRRAKIQLNLMKLFHLTEVGIKLL